MKDLSKVKFIVVEEDGVLNLFPNNNRGIVKLKSFNKSKKKDSSWFLEAIERLENEEDGVR